MAEMTKIIPSPGYCFVVKVEKEDLRASETSPLVLANTDQSDTCVVTECGKQRKSDEFLPEVGSVVLLQQGAGQFVRLGKIEGWLIETSDIIGYVQVTDEAKE